MKRMPLIVTLRQQAYTKTLLGKLRCLVISVMGNQRSYHLGRGLWILRMNELNPKLEGHEWSLLA